MCRIYRYLFRWCMLTYKGLFRLRARMEKTQQNQQHSSITVKDMLNFILNIKVKDVFSIFIIFIATFCSFITVLEKVDIYLNNCKNETIIYTATKGLTYRVYGRNTNSGYLKHVFAVLDRLGYKNDPNSTNWDLLWAHDYPFRVLYSTIKNLKPHQKVNHFPGCGFITNKVDLSTSNLKYMPKAFKLPQQKTEFLSYAKNNPEKLFVQKSNDHRGIKLRKPEEIDFDNNGTFIQEFVDRPYLVDGYKFDVGVYTIITSIDPLRVYVYNGDVLFRYCPVEYFPFDPNNLDKYIVGDDYLPTWKVPSLKYYYNSLGFSMRDSFDAYARDHGKDPAVVWMNIEDAIRHVLLRKEESIVNIMQRFKSKRNFFELMRFDFVIDEDLNVYLMEANMSPNLSSAHFPPNQLLYEQVIYNLFSLVGIAERVRKTSLAPGSKQEELMLTADKNLMVFPNECNSDMCRKTCMSPICQICLPCLDELSKEDLKQAYREYVNRLDCKRIFPPPLIRETLNSSIDLYKYSAENHLQYRWFVGKCLLDSSWC